MNNRCKELATQVVGLELLMSQYAGYERDLEKFAELIVKECAKLQYKNVVVGGVSEYNRGRRELAEDIFKHFGVKE